MSDLFHGLSAPDDHDEPGTGRRRLLVVGGLAAAALLGAGYLALGSTGAGPGGGPEAAGVPPVVVTGAPSARPTPTPTPTAPPTAAAAGIGLTGPTGRNPFNALYVLPGAAGGSGDAGVPSSPAPTGDAAAPSASPAAPEPYPLKLVSVDAGTASPRQATFLVGTVSTKVLLAQRFGATGELAVLDWTAGTDGAPAGVLLQVGAATPLRVAVGQTVKVL